MDELLDGLGLDDGPDRPDQNLEDEMEAFGAGGEKRQRMALDSWAVNKRAKCKTRIPPSQSVITYVYSERSIIGDDFKFI